ncbi:hypothetical protein [Acidithiobacillus albertensis]|uniref:hypothetical protein n=1 Tax=Acidithiobacillus albertensis TaxID=119978 RepID=UPI000A9C2B85|nr:hypothetical protein [Acidithiobacillus albertensis]
MMRLRKIKLTLMLTAFIMIPCHAYAENFSGTITDGEPCSKADLFRSNHGDFELLPGQTKGIKGNVEISGLVYPKASICKVYPFLRVKKIAREGHAKKKVVAPGAPGKISKITVFTTKALAGKAMAEAVKLKQSHSRTVVILKISGANMENLAQLAVAMHQEHIPFRKGLEITEAGRGSPTSGVQIDYANGTHKWDLHGIHGA